MSCTSKTTNTIYGPEANYPGNLPGDWVPGSYPAIVNNWGEVDAPLSIPASFLRHFNVYVKADSGWTLGYLRETGTNSVPYSTDLDSINCTMIQNAFVEIPEENEGVIGLTDPDKDTEGYFYGDPDTHEFVLYRIIAITDGSTVHLIKVTEQNAIENPSTANQWKSSVVFQHTSCSDCSISLSTNKGDKLINSFIEFLTKKSKLVKKGK